MCEPVTNCREHTSTQGEHNNEHSKQVGGHMHIQTGIHNFSVSYHLIVPLHAPVGVHPSMCKLHSLVGIEWLPDYRGLCKNQCVLLL